MKPAIEHVLFNKLFLEHPVVEILDPSVSSLEIICFEIKRARVCYNREAKCVKLFWQTVPHEDICGIVSNFDILYIFYRNSSNARLFTVSS